MLLHGGADHRRPRLRRVVRGAPLRQPPGLQAVPQELPCHRRGPGKSRHAPRGARGVGPPGGLEHREAGDSGRRAARAQLQCRGRRPPAEELPLRHDSTRLLKRHRNRRSRVVRCRRASRKHERRNLRVCGYHRTL